MNTEIRYPFDTAKKVADYIINLLKPHCEQIHIAGSIRRMRPDVKDIEIVCQPKKEIKHEGLFQDEIKIIDRNFIEALATITAAVIKGNVNGRYMQIKTNSQNCPGIYLDLFMPDPLDYFRQYAIRTGSADYAHHTLAGAWRKKGWAAVKDTGLRLISECDAHSAVNGKVTFHTIKKDLKKITMPPVWTSEGQFFTWLGLEYIDPEYREINSTVDVTR